MENRMLVPASLRCAFRGFLVGALVTAGAATGLCQATYDDIASSTLTDLGDGDLAGSFFEPTELAGNVLGTYPHFEYVLAFNEGLPITFALDPTRFPATAGQTVDIYIIDARSKLQWMTDGTLTDVRGAPQTETLGVATIQSSTFALTGSDLLSGDAGTGLGVPYDVVCDVNRNANLDAGDFIDGFGDRAGFYVVHDVTQSGPLGVTELTYAVQAGSVTAGFEGENLFYPVTIGTMGELPLVVVSHGNGHQYQWYDHIGEHLASYGYVVMSHQNNTIPGVQTSATTTLEHTDAFLGQLATIAGGVLQGHIDKRRIVWIGHSRGGEGVAIAYDRLFDGTWNAQNYDREDIVLISSIAPVDFEGPAATNPHGAAYSLWTGGADSDVNGCANSNVGQTFHLHDRAQKWRQSISLHGVGHGDFHNGFGGAFATGPCLVGRVNTHQIVRGYLLPLVKHYVEGNVPARDFLWRQWESFRPIGAPVSGCVSVDLMFREDPILNFVVDDFQTEATTDLSSSGGAVTFSVSNVSEGLADDANSSFTHNVGDVMNGMTLARAQDSSRGTVFEWSTDAFYEHEIVSGERDLTDDEYLTFRACQATRHPNTTADIEDLTFTISLIDGALDSSSINIGAFGGGLEEPYQRTGCGAGAGWANEFETIRIRLTDFLNNGSGLDLSDVRTIRFDFGTSFGSGTGRIGLDEITLSSDPEQPRPRGLTIAPDPWEIVPEGASIIINARIVASGEHLLPGTAQMHYRFDGGAFSTVSLFSTGPDLFVGVLPPADCADDPEYYFSAEGSLSGLVTMPSEAPTDLFAPSVGALQPSFTDDFESDQGWAASAIGATSGFWQRGVPIDDAGSPHDPLTDGDGSGSCYLTQNEPGDTDVDGGFVRLTSPLLDLASDVVAVRYDYYLKLGESGGADQMIVEYNGDGSPFWQIVATHDTDGGLNWRSNEITDNDILAVGGTLSSTARFRFIVRDSSPDHTVEAGIDGFTVETVQCP
jgi:hypothetical protein